MVQVNLHAAPITIAKAKTPIATIETAIMMNQAHMTATDAHRRGKTPKVRKVKCIAHHTAILSFGLGRATKINIE